jgi:ADP-heptose:LPS heptosyltransferase
VLSTPAIHLLKSARPDLHIAVVVEPRFAPVFTGNPDIQSILPLAVRGVRQMRPSLCLNLHGGTRSLILTALSGARFKAGFGHHRHSAAVYNVPIPTAQEILNVNRRVHTAEHLASAMFRLGVPQAEIPRARLFTTVPNRPHPPYAVIHAVAATPAKTWPAEGFLRVARTLRDAHTLRPVFIGGANDDLSAFAEFEVRAGAPLEHIKSLLAGASLFVGNDSGPAHMAAAFGIPQVVLFGASDPVVWAPWRTEAEVLTSHGAIANIRVEQVLEAASRLMVAR